MTQCIAVLVSRWRDYSFLCPASGVYRVYVELRGELRIIMGAQVESTRPSEIFRMSAYSRDGLPISTSNAIYKCEPPQIHAPQCGREEISTPSQLVRLWLYCFLRNRSNENFFYTCMPEQPSGESLPSGLR